MKALLTLIILINAFPSTLKGQFYNPDPFDYISDHSQKEILENNISKIEVISYSNFDSLYSGWNRWDSLITESIQFNEFGLPICLQYGRRMPSSRWKNFLIKRGWDRHQVDSLWYNFEYDSLKRLIHICGGYGLIDSEPCYNKNDIFNSFDENNRLINQRIVKKYIYPMNPSFPGRTIYPNDTNRINIKLNYQGNLVSTINRTSDGYNTFTFNNRYDTLEFNCPFDSVFLKQPIAKGWEKDSLNRIIKTTRFSHYVCFIGGCESIENENDIIESYIYGANGKLISISTHYRSGYFLSKKVFQYDDKGLLKFEITDSVITKRYTYKRFSKNLINPLYKRP